MAHSNREPAPRLAYHIDEFAAAAGLTRTRVYAEAAAGRLRTFKVGRRRMVAAEAARQWLEWAQREGGAA